MRDLFVTHFAALRDTCGRLPAAGVAIVAIDETHDRIAGAVCVEATPTRPNAAIVGRHSRADLYLPDDPTVALRHLAIIVPPLLSSLDATGIRYRVVDLRTGIGFGTERDPVLHSITADGPACVRVAGYALFCLPAGEAADWPDDPDAAWERFPACRYVTARPLPEGLPAVRRPPRGTPAGRRGSPRDTLVVVGRGPFEARRADVLGGGPPVGELVVEHRGGGRERLLVGDTAAAAGILLGRYPRCDVDLLRAFDDESVSRVHLLVVRVGDRMVAIDTASTNGTWPVDADGACGSGDGTPPRVVDLTPSRTLELGRGHVAVAWNTDARAA
ncbi:MAG: FHA domain-containing protein [Deltaproteobacteria bacterium]|nr:MAG: FHA domain-containing protein [Deltaproteobacteria bacterium]